MDADVFQNHLERSALRTVLVAYLPRDKEKITSNSDQVSVDNLLDAILAPDNSDVEKTAELLRETWDDYFGDSDEDPEEILGWIMTEFQCNQRELANLLKKYEQYRGSNHG